MPRKLDHSVIECRGLGSRLDGATRWNARCRRCALVLIAFDQVVQLHLEPQMRIAEGSGPSWPSD
jgi:hypothetical protein